MRLPTLIRTLLLSAILAGLSAVTHAGITVQQGLGPGATSWPSSPILSTTSTPNAQSTVGESFSTNTSIGQAFTLPAGSNYTLQTIYLYAGGGTGTGGSAPVTVNLYDLGAIVAPNPSSYPTASNLLGGGSGVAITYTSQTLGLLKLDFTGADQVTLAAGHMYVFELTGSSGTNPLPWYRTTSDTYTGGAAYRDHNWINGTNARDFALAVYGAVTTNQPAPANCTVNAGITKQKIDGFGAGVAFLNNGIVQLTNPQMDQLYGTSGTQSGLTLLRLRISPDGDNTYSMQDAQKAYARGARILATPWSPPAAMKDNNSLIHGSLLPSQYAAYVTYLNNFASYMAANNAPLAVISIQNEPDFDPTYEGCAWSAEQFRIFCRDFAGGINVPVMMPESFGFDQAVSNTTLNDSTAVGNIDYIGGHLYGATIKDYPLARSKGLPVWMTEYLENDQTIESAVTTGRQISECLSVGNMSAYIWWKCIGDANGLLDASGAPQRRSHVMAQFSRFVRPGDYRVDVPTNTGPLGITAFKDVPSGRFAIVAVNNTTLPVTQDFALQGITLSSVTPTITSSTQTLATQTPVSVASSAFSYVIPANSVVTFSGLSTTTVAPVFTTQPTDRTIITGNSVTFTAVASGNPAPTYQWQKNNTNLPGATSSSFTLTNAAAGDAGSYRVIATNSAGTATSNAATLTVNVAPVFTTQPLSLPAFVGSTITFTSLASSSTAITYQWQKGGINLPNATSANLTLNNVQLTDAGSYAVIATDSVGSTTSRFARLVVLVSQSNAIVYATTVSSTSVTAGGMVNLAYFMTNVGTHAWGASHYLSIRDINNTFVGFSSLIGTLPGEATTATLRFAAPTTPGVYTYYVQALEDGVAFFSTQTTLTLTVLAPLTNSITYNTTTFPVSAAPGSNVVFTYNVTNTGTQTWGANHILSLNDSNGTTLSSALLTVLAPGGSKTVNLSFTAPTAPGTYNYTVQAAVTGVGNFNTQSDLTLVVLAPRPNAIVYTRTRSPDQVVPGATLNLKYSLSNAGTQAWGAGHYVSLRDETGAFLAFIALNGVATGSTTNVAFSFTAPTTPGLHTYFVQALEDGVEFFSTQDVVVVQVDALPLANAITYDATTFPATAAPGSTVSFTYTITNRGTKTWGSRDYLSFRDVDNTFLGFRSITGVAPGASKTVTMSFTAPTTPGIYTYKAQGLEDGVAFYAMDDTLVLFVQ